MASVTHMGVAATDHVVLYAFRNIADDCRIARGDRPRLPGGSPR